MNAKIDRICNEIDKTKGKINELQNKLRELEKQKTELENIEIVDVVRGMDISFADLAELLKTARMTSGQVDPKSGAGTTAKTKQMETDKEDENE